MAPLMAGAALASCSAESAPAPTQPVATRTAEALPETHQSVDTVDNNLETRRRATRGAVDVANGLLDILADKRSTTTDEYRGNMVGNKDAERPANVPEMAVGFDHEKGEMYFLAAQGYDTETGEMTAGFDKGSENESFSSITMTLEVDKDNPIYGIHRQLTMDDFRQALNQRETLNFKSAEGSWFEIGIPGVRAYSIEESDNSLLTAVDEDASGAGYMYGIEPKNDPNTIDRALQIMGATVENFKADLDK